MNRCVCACMALVLASPVAAEFYSWTDAGGERRISNVAPRGVDEGGQLRRGYHPNSVAAQHARLRETLARQAALIEAEAAAREARTRTPSLLRLPSWLGGDDTAADADAPASRW